jgi:hypothetical protein
VRLNLDLCRGEETGVTLVIVDLVVDEVPLAFHQPGLTGHSLDSVQSLDIVVALVLESGPVKVVDQLGGGRLVAEPVRSGFADVIGNVGSVPEG